MVHREEYGCIAGLRRLFTDACLGAKLGGFGIAGVFLDCWDLRVAQRVANCIVVRKPSAARFTKMGSGIGVRREGHEDLPGPWFELLAKGQVWSALILSTTFSEKYKGRNMKVGDTAVVAMPTVGPGPEENWKPKLLHRSGSPEAMAFIWCGDASAGDKTIYVSFSMMRKFTQAAKILFSPLENEGACRLSSDEKSPFIQDGSEWFTELRLSVYIRQLVDELWKRDGLAEKLAETTRLHPNHRIIFAGISHGAALAQVCAVRFNLANPGKAMAITWNAYRWTDAVGSELVARTMGDRLLPLVLTRRIPRRGCCQCSSGGYRSWDSIPSLPENFAATPNSYLLDVDAGGFTPCKKVDNWYSHTQSDWAAFRSFWRLHHALQAIIATKLATKHALEGGRTRRFATV